MKRYLEFKMLMLLIVFITSGCAGFGAPIIEASKSLDLKAREFNPPEGRAAIYIIRPYQFVAAGSPIHVYLDHEKFGEVPPGSFIYGEILPREHTIELAEMTGLENTTLQFTAEAGMCYFFYSEINLRSQGLEGISSDKGKELVNKYKLSGQNKFDIGREDLTIKK